MILRADWRKRRRGRPEEEASPPGRKRSALGPATRGKTPRLPGGIVNFANSENKSWLGESKGVQPFCTARGAVPRGRPHLVVGAQVVGLRGTASHMRPTARSAAATATGSRWHTQRRST